MGHNYTGEDDRCTHCDNRRYRGGPCIDEKQVEETAGVVQQGTDPSGNQAA